MKTIMPGYCFLICGGYKFDRFTVTSADHRLLLLYLQWV